MKNLNLIAFRKNSKKSISEMAEIIGLSASYYEKIERGDRMPSFNFLVKFKSSFPNIDTEQFFLTQNHTKCVEHH